MEFQTLLPGTISKKKGKGGKCPYCTLFRNPACVPGPEFGHINVPKTITGKKIGLLLMAWMLEGNGSVPSK